MPENRGRWGAAWVMRTWGTPGFGIQNSEGRIRNVGPRVYAEVLTSLVWSISEQGQVRLCLRREAVQASGFEIDANK